MGFYYLGQTFVLGAVIIRVLATLSGSELVPRDDPGRYGNSSSKKRMGNRHGQVAEQQE
jgi:hypothetical protein